MADGWTETENDVIVADYLAMLRDELAGRPYSKAEHNRNVQTKTGRGRGSVEFKHQNISAVLMGAPRLIEVKTTNGWERTPFHISYNELEVAKARGDEWNLVRVWNFARQPRAFEIRPPLAAHVSLMPTSYRAEFTSRQ